jgi:hypothetical protein
LNYTLIHGGLCVLGVVGTSTLPQDGEFAGSRQLFILFCVCSIHSGLSPECCRGMDESHRGLSALMYSNSCVHGWGRGCSPLRTGLNEAPSILYCIDARPLLIFVSSYVPVSQQAQPILTGHILQLMSVTCRMMSPRQMYRKIGSFLTPSPPPVTMIMVVISTVIIVICGMIFSYSDEQNASNVNR